ncbi:MAG: ribosome silencing factor [Pseudomonadota bacterium]
MSELPTTNQTKPELLTPDQLVKIAVAALEDIKGKDITVINVAHLTSLFDRMIIASGDSTRQVKSLADNVLEKLKEAGADIIGTEGADVGEWVLVDAASLVVHVMHPAVRAHYNLEELWGAAQQIRKAAG